MRFDWKKYNSNPNPIQSIHTQSNSYTTYWCEQNAKKRTLLPKHILYSFRRWIHWNKFEYQPHNLLCSLLYAFFYQTKKNTNIQKINSMKRRIAQWKKHQPKQQDIEKSLFTYKIPIVLATTTTHTQSHTNNGMLAFDFSAFNFMH